MRVHAQFFAQLRDLTGTSKCDVDVAAGSTIRELLELLYQQFPALRSSDRSILVGAGVEFVGRGYELKPNDEIAIMPPVQGG